MNIVLTGGGTGGHIYPALAIADALMADGDVDNLLYVGKKDGLEASLVEKKGVPFEGISFFGMPRKNPIKWIQWFFQLNRAVAHSKEILKNFHADVVMGTGGYVSAPVLIAASRLNIPVLLHEPDAHPGLANKYLAKKARVITAAFEAAESQFKMGADTKFVTTGNPIQVEHSPLDKSELFKELGLNDWDVNKPILLVFGGSQGARSINQATVKIAHQLVFDEGLQVYHVAGSKLYEETRTMVNEDTLAHSGYHLVPFCHVMSKLMAVSELVICRSGSVSLSELFVSGLPSILVPFPYAAADHQRKNARFAVAKGAAVMLEDLNLTPEILLSQVKEMIGSPFTLSEMKESARLLARPNATNDIVALIKQVANCELS